MPQLNWNEQEFIDCLAVLPKVEEDDASHIYTVTDGVLTLVLTVWRYESVVQFDLNQATTGEEVMSFALVVRDGICYRDEKWGESLGFHECIVAPRRFYAIDMGDVFRQNVVPKWGRCGIIGSATHSCPI